MMKDDQSDEGRGRCYNEELKPIGWVGDSLFRRVEDHDLALYSIGLSSVIA
jgi:hypothetical protein